MSDMKCDFQIIVCNLLYWVIAVYWGLAKYLTCFSSRSSTAGRFPSLLGKRYRYPSCLVKDTNARMHTYTHTCARTHTEAPLPVPESPILIRMWGSGWSHSDHKGFKQPSQNNLGPTGQGTSNVGGRVKLWKETAFFLQAVMPMPVSQSPCLPIPTPGIGRLQKSKWGSDSW